MSDNRDAADRVRDLVSRVDGLEATIKSRGDGEAVPLRTIRDPMVTTDGVTTFPTYVAPGDEAWSQTYSDYINEAIPMHFGAGATAIFNDFLGQSDESVRAVSIEDGGEISEYVVANEFAEIQLTVDEPSDIVTAEVDSVMHILDVSDPSNITEIDSFGLDPFVGDHCVDPSSNSIWQFESNNERVVEYDYNGNVGTTINVPISSTPAVPQLEYDTTTSTLFFLYGQENKLLAFDDAGNQRWSTTAVGEHAPVSSGGIDFDDVRRFSANNGAVVAVDSGTLKQWDAETGTVEWTASESGSGWCVSVSDEDGLVAVTHPGSSTAQFYDSNGNTAGSISLPSDAYLCAIVEPGSIRYLYVALDDKSERLYRTP